MVGASTQLLGVVGHPVAHTLSPSFWNPTLEAAGRDAVFLAFDVEPRQFDAFVHGMNAAGAAGLNVTMPHKSAAYAVCEQRSTEAAATGAVNAIWFSDGRICGANTDVAGVAAAVADLDVPVERALVLGAGGAGRAAVHALRGLGAQVQIANRTHERAEALAGQADVIEWSQIAQAAAGVDLVVHTTSLGLDGTESPLSAEDLVKASAGRLAGVLDVVYRADETPLVHLARRAGLSAADGLRMLVFQAAEAWRLFFGEQAPAETMQRFAAHSAGRPAVTGGPSSD